MKNSLFELKCSTLALSCKVIFLWNALTCRYQSNVNNRNRQTKRKSSLKYKCMRIFYE